MKLKNETLTSSIDDLKMEVKRTKEREIEKKEALENESMQEENNLENAGSVSKKCVQGITKVMDNSMKFHRHEKEDFKELIWRKKKNVHAKNYEDAEGRILATRGASSKLIAIEETSTGVMRET